jgi:hypothetical protein
MNTKTDICAICGEESGAEPWTETHKFGPVAHGPFVSARTITAEFTERADSLINDLADTLQHEPCAWTLKASSGEILDHLLSLAELGPKAAEAQRCGRGYEPAGWWDASVIIEGALDEESELHSQAELDALVARLDRLAKDGKPTELYLLYHDHGPLDDGAEDVCVQYLTDHHAYKTWNTETEVSD